MLAGAHGVGGGVPAQTLARGLPTDARPPRSRPFFDKRMAQEVSGDSLGEARAQREQRRQQAPLARVAGLNLKLSSDAAVRLQEFKGYVFKIMGGQDKEGFPMKQGVLTNGRVRLLMHRGDPCFRGYGRRNGERRRKSVRGCVVSQDLATLNLVVVRQGENTIPGLNDEGSEKPRMRGPKRASKIRKLFDLKKEDDVRKYVNTYRREFTDKAGKKHSRAPKIQRLVTPVTLQRKRARKALKKTRIEKSKADGAEYHKLLALRMKERRERRSESLAKRRSVSKAEPAAK
jgi:small subunit ribosomal protein S6e